jgi:acetate kinase
MVAGLHFDEERNGAAVPDTEISAAGSAVPVLVIAAREDLSVLAEVRRVENE